VTTAILLWASWAAPGWASGPGAGPLPTIPAARLQRAPFTVGLIDLRHLGRTGEEAEVRRALLDHLRARGLPVRGGETREPDRSVEARFVLLGEIAPSSEGMATVRWQLVDRRDEATTFEATTQVAAGSTRRPLVDAIDRLARSSAFARALVAAAARAARSRSEFVLRRCLTPGTEGRARVGRGPMSGAAVVVSPDGYAWASARSIPVPPAPIEVRTTTGSWPARWLGASAELDVALLALPTGSETPCSAVADHLPRARETALAWHPRQGRRHTRILGFRLHEQPGTIVVEAPLGPGAFLFDATGAVLGLRVPHGNESRVRPHSAVAAALGVHWGPISVVVEPEGGEVQRPDPIFLPPIEEADGTSALR